MKRLLHALAVLWPLPPRTEPSPCEFVDLPIRELAKSQPSASAQKANGVKRRPDERSDIGISESILNNKTIFHLVRRYCNVLAFMTLFMCLIAAYKAPAQTGAAVNMDEIQQLQVGSLIPDEIWQKNLLVLKLSSIDGEHTMKLEDHRGKIIILDFWATYCSSCLVSMPKLESIQTRFPEEIITLLVNPKGTRDDTEKILTTLAKQPTPIGLPTLVEDTVLSQLFDIRGLPTLVWIDEDGRVMAITNRRGISEGFIKDLITNR